MVLTQLKGGLGNQMFQYAIGRALSLRLDTSLLLDTRWYSERSGNTPRTFDLLQFGRIRGLVASKKDYDIYGGNIVWTQVARKAMSFPMSAIPIVWNNVAKPLFWRMVYREPTRLFQERTMRVDEEFTWLSGNIHLVGGWITEGYFRQVRDVIVEDFTFPPLQKNAAMDLAADIAHSESIAVHVRCGDYRNNRRYREYYTMLDNQYYRNAIDYITSHSARGMQIKLFVFSDEPARVEEVFPLKQAGLPFTIVSVHSSVEAVHDLHLMSLCKHTVIANSTFSWWGAWLNRNPAKIVVCPQKWYVQETMNGDAHDYFPPGWIALT